MTYECTKKDCQYCNRWVPNERSEVFVRQMGSGKRSNNTRMIINSLTGETFESIRAAHSQVTFGYVHFSRMLSGAYFNKTPFVKLKQEKRSTRLLIRHNASVPKEREQARKSDY